MDLTHFFVDSDDLDGKVPACFSAAAEKALRHRQFAMRAAIHRPL
ncbi:hypothetical protein [Burkholderia pseudomultivorans]|nr:hypothetical protein [Burkholderia pseudomultivorans]